MSGGGIKKQTSWFNSHLTQIVGGFVMVSLTLVILLIILGPSYPGVIESLGLDWFVNAQQGVYADCSKAENKNVPYCRPKAQQGEQGWNELRRSNGKPVPFSLSR